MRDVHVSAEVMDRFARGDLEEAELLEVAHHLEGCEVCAGAGMSRAADDLGALRVEFTGVEEKPRMPLRWIAAVAAALAVVALLAFFIPRRTPQTPSSPPVAVVPPVTNVTAPPRAVEVAEARYADPEWEKLVADARDRERLPFPAGLAALVAPPDIVRGGSAAVERVTPAGIVIDDVRPTFSWPAREAGTYVVSVFDDDRQVVQSESLEVPRWKPKRDLPRGRTLTWQVEVTGGGAFETIPSPPSPPAMFRIVREADHRALSTARTRHPDDELLHAVLFARSGMRAEALAALRHAAETDAAAKRILSHETSQTQ